MTGATEFERGKKRRRDAGATEARRGDLADLGRSGLRPYMDWVDLNVG
jgi:hypothetical protein